ncbi:lytic murein transglycosylase [Bradyrhizobium iriomotense]|uniref:Transglycosylase n=1 Tax=Bradyrhizobium iriomotense TaxID=441950 RepID=A0ABQ6AZ73_9BRAD|nr:lytic murein transglycosylase [Bradyrhizobium iriomotense]GLR87350.1 transglycosylase [Bradyrhizobium iriomotense]
MRELAGNTPKGLSDKGCSGSPARALLRILRRTSIAGTIALVMLMQALEARAEPAFDAWRAQLWLEAQARGVKQAVFDRATNVQLDLGLPDLVIPGRPVKEQAEFVKLPADYLPRQQLTGLARTGARHFQSYRDLLARIEADYGVPGNVVIAIWGRETDYGAEVQRHPVFQALVTQAYLGRRKDLFRSELLIALDLVQQGTISMDAKGSYTGAMGHTQFEPSDFLKFAADGDGDGKIDLERSIPDALASGAKQLRDYGWQRGKRWGFKVRLPPTVSCVESSPDVKRPLEAWLKLGVMPVGDPGIATGMLQDPAQLVMPAGVYGPAFLVFANFQAIRSYNQSDVYALFVGHLADLIAGGAPFVTPWARLKPLRNSEVAAIQTQLNRSGYYSDAIDGRLGTVTRRAIGQYQRARA